MPPLRKSPVAQENILSAAAVPGGEVIPHHNVANTGEGQDDEQGHGLLAGQVDPGKKWINSELISFRYIISPHSFICRL